MSEETTETTEEVKPEPEAKGMRAQIESLSAENRELKADKRDGIISGLGLDTQSGLGMALAEQFDKGDLALGDIASTATEKYGHVVTEAVESHPAAGIIAQEQAALDQIGQTAGSVPVAPTEGDALAQAEAAGDYGTALNIKGQQMADMLKTRR